MDENTFDQINEERRPTRLDGKYIVLAVVLFLIIIAYSLYAYIHNKNVESNINSEIDLLTQRVMDLSNLYKCDAAFSEKFKEDWQKVFSTVISTFIIFDGYNIYRITNDKGYLERVENQIPCLEERILPLDFNKPTYDAYFNFSNPDYAFYSTIIDTLSPYYYEQKGMIPDYLNSLANYLLNNTGKLKLEYFDDFGFNNSAAALSLKRFLTFYDYSKDPDILIETKRVADELFEIKSSTFEYSMLLLYYLEYYNRTKDDSVLLNISVLSSVLPRIIDDKGQLSIKITNPRGDPLLLQIRVSFALSKCAEIIKSPECKNALLRSLNYQLSQIDFEKGKITYPRTESEGLEQLEVARKNWRLLYLVTLYKKDLINFNKLPSLF